LSSGQARYLIKMPIERSIETVGPGDEFVDEDLLDLIEQPFLEPQIDGETLTPGLTWLEGNVSETH